jgi:hypothetical protein
MAEPNNPYKFRGFQNPNYTIVPDELFDELLALLSGAELKILLYIIRRTFGFKKESDEISLSQICKGISKRDGQVLDQGTGLSQSTAQIAIKGLEEKNIIVATRRVSPERGNEPTTYSLNFVQPSTENRQRGVPKIGEALYRKSATQETVKQETDIHPSNIRKASPFFEKNEQRKSNPSARPDPSIPHRYRTGKNMNTDAATSSAPPTSIRYQTKSQRQKTTAPNGVEAVGSIMRRARPQAAHQTYDEDRQVILEFIEDFAREFNDQASLKSSTTRAYNLYQQSGLPIGSFIGKLHEARSITKESTAQIRSQTKEGGGAPTKRKMAYWFSVVEDLLGLKDQGEQV